MIKKHIYNLLLKIRDLNSEKQYAEIKSMKSREEYLERLLYHSYHNVPYYHQIFKEFNMVRNNKVDLSKFGEIPMLTKEIIRKHSKELTSKDYTSRRWYYNSSGGSTGEPVGFIQDNLYSRWGSATNRCYYEDIIGIDEINAKKIILWGSERDLFRVSIGTKAKISNWLRNTVFLNSFKMTERDIDQYIKIINSYKPDLIRGYTGSLYELCRYAERKSIKIYTPKILVSAAETLRDEMREKIENIFGTKLYNFYGSREVGPIAGECKCGLMHIFTFNQYVEILDSNNCPVEEGQEGRVIVTTLHNYSMPFIRYEIGDMAIPSKNEKCSCGRGLPLIESVVGRQMEVFRTKEGNIVPAEFFIHFIGVVYNKGIISKFQVIQEDYEQIVIKAVIKDMEKFNKYKEDIDNSIKKVMGQDCEIIWEFVDDIPKTPQGKYLYVKSLIQK